MVEFGAIYVASQTVLDFGRLGYTIAIWGIGLAILLVFGVALTWYSKWNDEREDEGVSRFTLGRSANTLAPLSGLSHA